MYLISFYVCFLVLCILFFCIVLYIVSPFVYSCPFPIFVQVYRPLSPGGNPIAVKKHHIFNSIKLILSHVTLL